MQILSHFPNPLSSHTFWILPILPNPLFPSNYISFVTTKIFFPHLSLSQFHLQIQSNTITIPRFLSSVFFHSIPERPIVHSPCPKSPLLRCSQITLPSFPLNPLFHRFFFPLLLLLLLLSSHTVSSSQPSSFIHSYNLSSACSARPICPVPR